MQVFNNNDILVVDKGFFPSNNSIVIASLHGELLIKKFLKNKSGSCYLKSENTNYPQIRIKFRYGFKNLGCCYVLYS